MNVVCGRCGTEYEFDDALVSERGTTVRCTQCGYQFRIRPPGATDASNAPDATRRERWIIRRRSGATRTFYSLSELQRAIHQRQIDIDDELSRDGSRYRPLRAVAELEAFFEPSQKRPPGRDATLLGVGQADDNSPTAPPPPQAVQEFSGPYAAAVPRARPAGPGSFHSRGEQRSFESFANPLATGLRFEEEEEITQAYAKQSLQAAPAGVQAPQEQQQASQGQQQAPQGQQQAPQGQQQAPQRQQPAPLAGEALSATHSGTAAAGTAAAGTTAAGTTAPGTAALGTAAPGEPHREPELSEPAQEAPAGVPRRRRERVYFAAAPTPVQSATTPHTPSSDEPSSSHLNLRVSSPAGGGGLRWIFGFVLLGGLALLAGTVGRSYLEQFVPSQAARSSPDTRAEDLLREGDALLRDGKLEAAKARFDKASVLLEGDARVLSRLLRVQNLRADRHWLALRLLEPQHPRATQAERALEARQASIAESLQSLRRLGPPHDASVEIVDGLRLSGGVSAAREVLEQASELVREPDAAYVLAMLDVAEQDPEWSTVLARLRTAVAVERGQGRAQAALVYALARSGDSEAAVTQLDVLRQLDSEYPLLDLLAEFAQSAASQASASAATAASEAPPVTGRASGQAPAASAPRSAPSAPEDALSAAHEAKRAGDWSRASRLYTQVLSSNPSHVEAMTGLGDVAKAQGKHAVAASHYDAALRVSGNYAPALMGSADSKWAMGNRSSAVQLYRRIPAGSAYSARAQARIARFDGPGADVSAAASTSPSPPTDDHVDSLPASPVPSPAPDSDPAAAPGEASGEAP